VLQINFVIKEGVVMSDEVSKSWFVVFNNPKVYGYQGEPHEIIQCLIDEWIKDRPSRTCAMTYCISSEGLEHVHMVGEDVKAMRFSAVKKAFPHAHLEPTKGTKEQAENYIKKRGKFEEKGEVILYEQGHGEIKGCQGSRRDFDILEEYIGSGFTPQQILSMSMAYRRYEKYIKDAYFSKRREETPYLRKINCIWHVGESGSGKSYTSKKIVDEKGEDYMYLVTDYDNGGLDNYNGEPILFLDEFRGQIKYSTLLTMLQGYKAQFHARYTNIIGLWNEVHITSVLPPDKVYKNMVTENQELDTLRQLIRRINTIIYHWKDNEGYYEFVLPMEQYSDYESLKGLAHKGFLPCNDDIPF